ncbi:uncharacterized protein LOC142341758 isoform X2 [Convolutriloba macropyga]|uniref:uncharacterized protein LOC142341758 isoform X2 n=1 Tax=Convolutriloba macropyga TaxID=536237 RepID=UPI003F51AECF
MKSVPDATRTNFRWYYPFGALVAFVGFFTFLGIVWVGYMVYMSQCKSRASQSRQPSIYKANEGGDGVGTSNNGSGKKEGDKEPNPDVVVDKDTSVSSSDKKSSVSSGDVSYEGETEPGEKSSSGKGKTEEQSQKATEQQVSKEPTETAVESKKSSKAEGTVASSASTKGSQKSESKVGTKGESQSRRRSSILQDNEYGTENRSRPSDIKEEPEPEEGEETTSEKPQLKGKG